MTLKWLISSHLRQLSKYCLEGLGCQGMLYRNGCAKIQHRYLDKFYLNETINFFFCIFFWRARVCRPLLRLCRTFMIFEWCLDSHPECCRSKLARYRLSHPSLVIETCWRITVRWAKTGQGLAFNLSDSSVLIALTTFLCVRKTFRCVHNPNVKHIFCQW